VFLTNKSPAAAYAFLSEDVPAEARTILTRLGWEAVLVRAEAVPVGENAHSALSLTGNAMHGVSRPLLITAMWMRLRQYCLAASMHSTSRRAGVSAAVELTPADVGAVGSQREAEKCAASEAAVHTFFVKAGFSGGVRGLSAHQHSNLHSKKAPKVRGKLPLGAGGMYTQIGQDATIRAMRRKGQNAGSRQNEMHRDFEAMQAHAARQAAQLRAAGLSAQPAPRPRSLKRGRAEGGGGGGDNGSGSGGYVPRHKRRRPKPKGSKSMSSKPKGKRQQKKN